MLYTSTKSKIQTMLKGTIFLLLSLFIIHCSNNYIDNIDRSNIYKFKPGFPEVTFTAAGVIDTQTDSTKINVSAEIMNRSLIFKNIDSLLTANVLLELQLVNESSETQIVNTFEFPITLKFNSNEKINKNNAYLFHRSFNALPGQYNIHLLVTDLTTNNQTARTSTAFIPNPLEEISHITNIEVSSKNYSTANYFRPITTYDLSGTQDSVKFTFQVTNNRSNEPITLKSRLIKFKSDTNSARSISWTNYSPSSLPYIGISYSKYDEIASSTRIITQNGIVNIEFIFPNIDRGNYRFEVFSDHVNDSENKIYRAREFSIKSKYYPALKTPMELAAPLIYLMDKKEHKKMMTIKDPVKMKQAIDKFWITNIKNKRLALNVIELYYERVEEANKQFSNFKEGWKTDMGMMYILFGAPKFITNSLNEVRWAYSTNLYDPETNFIFLRPKIKNKYYPFDNYILARSNNYFNIQYQQIQNWLSGNILRDNL